MDSKNIFVMKFQVNIQGKGVGIARTELTNFNNGEIIVKALKYLTVTRDCYNEFTNCVIYNYYNG